MTSPLRVALPADSGNETAWQMGVQALDTLGPKTKPSISSICAGQSRYDAWSA